MPFWGGAKLVSDGAKLGVVSNFDPAHVDCNAYELTLGEEVYVTPGMGENLKEHKKIRLSSPRDKTINGKTVKVGGGIAVIPPGQFAFLLTEEAVKIPRNAMGFISLKFGIKAKGLINVSGFHVDPGYSGNLIYSVFNAGPTPIQITRGEKLFLLWIADLSGPDEDAYVKSSPGLFEIPTSLISQISKENYSLQALSQRVDELSKRVTNITIGAVIATSVAALLLALLPLLESDKKSEPGIGTINLLEAPHDAKETSGASPSP